MKPSAIHGTTQRQLALERDESRIWETIDATAQQQVIEHVATLWVQHVIARRRAVQRNPATSESSSHKS